MYCTVGKTVLSLKNFLAGGKQIFYKIKKIKLGTVKIMMKFEY